MQRVNTQTRLDNTGVNYVNLVKQLTLRVSQSVMIVSCIHTLTKRAVKHVKRVILANMAQEANHTPVLVFV